MRAGADKASEGVVLLEVIVAVAILGISLFSLLQALTQAVAASAAVRNLALADRLLENLVNELQFEPLGEWEEEPQPLEIGTVAGDFGELYPGFHWERELVDTEMAGLYETRYTVFWEARGRSREETVWSYTFDAAEAAAAAVEGEQETPDTEGAPR